MADPVSISSAGKVSLRARRGRSPPFARACVREMASLQGALIMTAKAGATPAADAPATGDALHAHRAFMESRGRTAIDRGYLPPMSELERWKTDLVPD